MTNLNDRKRGHARDRLCDSAPRREAGFSFIDVMLALVVLTIGMLALADFQFVTSKSNVSSKGLTAAANVAEQKLEGIKGMVYTSIAAEDPAQVVSSGITFTRQVSVVPNSPIPNTTTVTVTVTWLDNMGTHTVPMTAIIAQ